MTSFATVVLHQKSSLVTVVDYLFTDYLQTLVAEAWWEVTLLCMSYGPFYADVNQSINFYLYRAKSHQNDVLKQVNQKLFGTWVWRTTSFEMSFARLLTSISSYIYWRGESTLLHSPGFFQLVMFRQDELTSLPVARVGAPTAYMSKLRPAGDIRPVGHFNLACQRLTELAKSRLNHS